MFHVKHSFRSRIPPHKRLPNPRCPVLAGQFLSGVDPATSLADAPNSRLPDPLRHIPCPNG